MKFFKIIATTYELKVTFNANEPSAFDQTICASVYGLKVVRKVAGYHPSRIMRK